MTQERHAPSVDISVEHFEGQKVFSLEGLRFPSLPARVITGRYPGNIMFDVVRKNGTELKGRVWASDEYPNGVPGTPPYFILRGLEGFSSEGAPHYLPAEPFDEGDILHMEELPWDFRVHLLNGLAPKFKEFLEFHKRYTSIREAFRMAQKDPETGKYIEGEPFRLAMDTFAEGVSALLAELKDQPEWPSVIELKAEEFEH